MRYLRSLCLLLLCIAFVTACAYRDEGEIDYRRTDSNSIAIENNQGEIIHIARLEDKNKPSGNTFMEGDRMTIRLITAFIEDYTEGLFSWINDIWEGQLRPRGEIAVLVNVIPLEGQEYSFNFNEDAHNQAQVAFYSNDVVAGQFLNFNNMPIYGPNSQGVKNGVGLEIWIMELDISTPIVGALLDKMAQSFKGSDGLGSQVLKGLGGSLTNAVRTSDTNFLYRALLVPPNSKNMTPLQAPLEIGNYVFIRAPKTVTINDINWAELRLDENTGRLYKCPDKIHEIEHEIEYGIHEVGHKIEDGTTKHTVTHLKLLQKAEDGTIHKVEDKNPENHNKNGDHEHTVDHLDPLSSEEKCKEYRDNNYLVIQINKEKQGKDMYVANQVFDDFVDAIEKGRGYNRVTGGVVKLKTQSLVNQIYDLCENSTGTKVQNNMGKKLTILNEFKPYWDEHISHSYIQYLRGKTNDTDLSRTQLGEILGDLSKAINTVSPIKKNELEYFTLSDQTTNTTIVKTTKDKMTKQIEEACSQPQEGG